MCKEGGSQMRLPYKLVDRLVTAIDGIEGQEKVSENCS